MTDKNRVQIFDTTLRDGEQSPGATMNVEHVLERVAANERAVASEHEEIERSEVGPVRKNAARLIDRMTGSELLRLRGEGDVAIVREDTPDVLSAVANHKHDRARADLATCLHDPLHHGPTSHGMHDLRKIAVHALALAGGENDRSERAR